MSSSENNSSSDQALYDALAFFGAITASVTHELNNVLGTIEQVNGLVEDLCFSPDVVQAGISDKLTSVAERINRQAERGTALIKRLNTFAHLTDRDAVDCNLNDVLENITSLTQRLAGLKKIQLAVQAPDIDLSCTANPFLVGQLIFRCIKCLLSITDANNTVSVCLTSVDGAPEISFETTAAAPKGLLDDDLLALAARIPVEMEETALGESLGLRARFTGPGRAFGGG